LLNDEGLDIKGEPPAPPYYNGGIWPMIKDPEAEAARLLDLIRNSDLEKLNERILLDRRSNTVVSHSDHLLLRVMRWIRETSSETLPENIPQVRPERICVLFVEADGPHSIVREMPLNERGEIVKAWPGGFFEEGLREVF
jgi:hypothetical protein